MKYKVILADPAWYFQTYSVKGSGRSPKYKTSKADVFSQLPVSSIADDDFCYLFMWFTQTFADRALQLGIEWGFEFKSICFTWIKTIKNVDRIGLPIENPRNYHMGTGYYTRSNPEYVYLFTRGKGKANVKDHSIRNLIIHPLMEHSRKPDLHPLIERLTGYTGVELFARRNYPNWICLGNEVQNEFNNLGDDLSVSIERVIANEKQSL